VTWQATGLDGMGRDGEQGQQQHEEEGDDTGCRFRVEEEEVRRRRIQTVCRRFRVEEEEEEQGKDTGYRC